MNQQKNGMGRLRVKVTGCIYKEWERGLKEQLINYINDQAMTVQIIKGLNMIKKHLQSHD